MTTDDRAGTEDESSDEDFELQDEGESARDQTTNESPLLIKTLVMTRTLNRKPVRTTGIPEMRQRCGQRAHGRSVPDEARPQRNQKRLHLP